jgi:hypothetical protein
MDLNSVPSAAPEHVNENVVALKIGGGTALVGLYGMTLNEWVAVLTILYMVAQIGLLVPRYYALVSGAITRYKQRKNNEPGT